MAGKRASPPEPAASEVQLVRRLVDEAKKKLEGRELTVAEFIKLLQLRRELEVDEVKEIEVRWVDPAATDEAGKP